MPRWFLPARGDEDVISPMGVWRWLPDCSPTGAEGERGVNLLPLLPSREGLLSLGELSQPLLCLMLPI